MKSIKVNRIQCRKCGDIITSETRNDFKYCKCEAIAIDGGLEYARRVGNKCDIIELTEFNEQDV